MRAYGFNGHRHWVNLEKSWWAKAWIWVKITKLGLGFAVGWTINWSRNRCDLLQWHGVWNEIQWTGKVWSQFWGSLRDWRWIWKFKVENHKLGFTILGVWVLENGCRRWRSGGGWTEVVDNGWWQVVVGCAPGARIGRGSCLGFVLCVWWFSGVFSLLVEREGQRKEKNKGNGKDHGPCYQIWCRILWE